MEDTRACSQGDVEPEVGVHRHHEAERRDEVESCLEAETQQMLPLESSARSRTDSVRSHRAFISEVSSPSILMPGSKRRHSPGLIVTSYPDTHADPQWMPFALRWYFITITAGLSVAFAATVLALYSYSNNNNGLCTEESAMPGWKFVPTLIAVLYTQLTAMTFGAVKRTEPFAKMARTDGRVPVARYTLFEKTKPWWTTLVRGFQKRRNGGSYNWVIILSCSIYILAILGISPISAALLGTKEVLQRNPEVLVQLEMRNGKTLHPRAERTTYLQTMGAILQNYSTSPWITDGFVILPFWPDDATDTVSPWDSQVSNSGTWEANTTILHNDLVCTEMSLKNKHLQPAVGYYDSIFSQRSHSASVVLASDHGCQLNLTLEISFPSPEPRAVSGPKGHAVQFSRDWISWSDIHNIIMDSSSTDMVRVNDDCHEEEIIIMSTPWWPISGPTDIILENMTTSGYVCHAEYSMATIPVRAKAASNALSVEFDKELFNQMRTPIPSTVLDLHKLHEIYTDTTWGRFVPQQSAIDRGSRKFMLGGAAAMLGISYNFSVPRMMADSNLLMVASQFRRRFFAEIVGTSLQHTGILEERHTTGRRLSFVRKVLISGQAASIICALLLVSSAFFLGVSWMTHRSKRALNTHHDPSTLLGTSIWASGNAMVLQRFTKFDLANRKILKEELANRILFSKHGKLDEVEAEFQIAKKGKANPSSCRAAPILPGLRLRNLVFIIFYILGLLAGIVVLYELSQRSGLHQGFFTYRANIKLLGNENTISPFAIIPPLLSVIATLWWESVDTTCRTVQPYISMQHHAKRPSQGIGMSYASTFWVFASAKAFKNRHWLLSLVTTTTFLLQVLTIAMSALFDTGNGVIISLSKIPQTLELRTVPIVREATVMTQSQQEALSTRSSNDPYVTTVDSTQNSGRMVREALCTSGTDWMYTAILQNAFRGPGPTWSQDDWSFVPVHSVLEDPAFAKERSSTLGGDRFLTTLTVQTSAIRARLDCSTVPWPKNSSLWLTVNDGARHDSLVLPNITGLEEFFTPDAFVEDGNFTTRLTAQADVVRCCTNLTVNALYNPATIAYWTENWWESYRKRTGTNGNFTVKWIRGPASFVRPLPLKIEQHTVQSGDMLYFPEPPAIQALNCMPTFESSRAVVTVDLKTGVVQQYRILDTPLREDIAWSDSFQWRTPSGHSRSDTWPLRNTTITDTYYDMNVTTSYGVFFMKSLLNAAAPNNAMNPDPQVDITYYGNDDLEDQAFNMRDNTTGLNLDFMSYAAYAQVGFNPTALLDPETLTRTSQKVFSTFFQHFISNNLSHELGGYVYQPIGTNLSVNPPAKGMPIQHTPDGSVAPKFEDIFRNTNETTTATISTPVEVLRMNPIAFWIATSILIWLIITIIILASVQRKYYGGMMRNVECIADVLVLIAGSERLLQVIREKDIDTILKEDKILTRLGWFRDADGTMRWRIEIVEEDKMQMQAIRLGPGYAPLSNGNEEDGADAGSTLASQC